MVKDVEKGTGESSGGDNYHCSPHQVEASASKKPLPVGDETESSVLITSSDTAEPLRPSSNSKNIGYQSFPTITVVESRRPVRDTALSTGWELYNLHLDKHPLLVKSLTAFFILGLADASAQVCQRILYGASSTAGWDCLRTLRFGIFGLVGAPWSHFFYHSLDTVLPPTTDPWTRITLFKVIIDQFIQAPILLAVMIVGLNIMEGQGIRAIQSDLQDRYWTSLVANWKLWLPASLVNLAFVKPSLRVLFVNVVFFVWTIILSIILNVDPSN